MKNLRQSPPVWLVLAGCFLFGFLMALFKGSAYNLRDELGNLSAPWVLLAFWSSALTAGGGRILRGLLLGTVGVGLAFVGFYALGETLVFHISILHGLADGVWWSRTGLVAGPVFGALGALEGRSRRGRLWFMMAALFILEPFAWIGYWTVAVGNRPVGHMEFMAYAIEVAVGILACVFVARRFGVFRRTQAPLG